MPQDHQLTSIASAKIIEKMTNGTLKSSEAKELNNQFLTRYLNVSKDTADRLKRSGQIFDFWKQILQNAHIKGKEENFYKSLNTIIDAAPTSMLAQFTKLYYNSIISQTPKHVTNITEPTNNKSDTIKKTNYKVNSFSAKDSFSLESAGSPLHKPNNIMAKKTTIKNKSRKLQKSL